MKDRPLEFEEVVEEVGWMVQELRNLGATVFENDVRSSVERILVVHKKMMRLDGERKLRLISGVLTDLSADVKKKMKGKYCSLSLFISFDLAYFFILSGITPEDDPTT